MTLTSISLNAVNAEPSALIEDANDDFSSSGVPLTEPPPTVTYSYVANNINLHSGEVAALINTGGSWDALYGSELTVELTSAWANVLGGANTIYFANNGDAASLYNTGGAWDAVTGSNGWIALTSAWANVTGGGDTISLDSLGGGLPPAVSLYNTGGAWDAISGGIGTIELTSAWANVSSGDSEGGETISFANDGCAASLYGLFGPGAWNAITGSDGTIELTRAWANVIGGADTIFLADDECAASLYTTGGAWDAVAGSNGSIALTNAWANVTGGGDTIDFASAGCAASLFNTGAHADTIEGASGSIGLANAAVNLPAASETISLLGAPAFGLDTISGFTSADSMAFSKSDFANWSALSSHISQSGANTLITLDANDVITLINVQASSLTSSQFSFV